MTHSKEQMLEASGLTYRQLDYWTRNGLLKCVKKTVGSGHTRKWLDGEVHVARAMCLLTEAGVAPDAANRAVRNDGWLSSAVRVSIHLPGQNQS
jgi:DNA-binding transcriptional MerR regulator